ncbi:hypothetical protein H1C71_015478, partial [Ictidomys tridecemlineatus]
RVLVGLVHLKFPSERICDFFVLGFSDRNLLYPHLGSHCAQRQEVERGLGSALGVSLFTFSIIFLKVSLPQLDMLSLNPESVGLTSSVFSEMESSKSPPCSSSSLNPVTGQELCQACPPMSAITVFQVLATAHTVPSCSTPAENFHTHTAVPCCQHAVYENVLYLFFSHLRKLWSHG